jgi:hypothetical protein
MCHADAEFMPLYDKLSVLQHAAMDINWKNISDQANTVIDCQESQYGAHR